MKDRAISLTDLNELRVWIETQPELPEGDWYKDFGSFKLCGSGALPKRSSYAGKPQRVKLSEQHLLQPCE
jgi:hypothetical protein